jgi:hypothetical protein
VIYLYCIDYNVNCLDCSVILQNKGISLGGLTGGDTGDFTARRSVEKSVRSRLVWCFVSFSTLLQ